MDDDFEQRFSFDILDQRSSALQKLSEPFLNQRGQFESAADFVNQILASQFVYHLLCLSLTYRPPNKSGLTDFILRSLTFVLARFDDLHTFVHRLLQILVNDHVLIVLPCRSDFCAGAVQSFFGNLGGLSASVIQALRQILCRRR